MSERECLQCGETKASIKRKQIVLCGIEEGYEYRELAHEWPHHRWADWTDAELARFGVKPAAFEKHRRTDSLTFQWIACDDTYATARADGLAASTQAGQMPNMHTTFTLTEASPTALSSRCS